MQECQQAREFKNRPDDTEKILDDPYLHPIQDDDAAASQPLMGNLPKSTPLVRWEVESGLDGVETPGSEH